MRLNVLLNLILRGPFAQKMTKLKKKFASNEVWTSSGCCCEILQLCDVCKWGLGEFEHHYNPSIFKDYLQKNHSPEKFHFLQLLKNVTLTVLELQDSFWYQKKQKFVIYKVTESFFFQFSNSDKNYAIYNFSEIWKKKFSVTL